MNAKRTSLAFGLHTAHDDLGESAVSVGYDVKVQQQQVRKGTISTIYIAVCTVSEVRTLGSFLGHALMMLLLNMLCSALTDSEETSSENHFTPQEFRKLNVVYITFSSHVKLVSSNSLFACRRCVIPRLVGKIIIIEDNWVTSKTLLFIF